MLCEIQMVIGGEDVVIVRVGWSGDGAVGHTVICPSHISQLIGHIWPIHRSNIIIKVTYVTSHKSQLIRYISQFVIKVTIQ